MTTRHGGVLFLLIYIYYIAIHCARYAYRLYDTLAIVYALAPVSSRLP